MARHRMLLLEYDATAAAEGTTVVCAAAGPVAWSSKEPVGHIFHYKVLLQQGLIDPPGAEDSNSSDAEDSSSNAANGTGVHASNSIGSNLEDLQPPPGVSWKKSKGKKKQVKSKDLDYYGLLGLQHERWMATDVQLKQAYRKACLEHHPDKKLVGVDCDIKKVEAEEHFKKIQEAYDTLSDPAKRREYDSVDEFDDSLPLDCDPADFFKVFAPAFRRNARWSVDSKAPDVGDESTPYDDVNKFYDFWYGFKSWREFPHPDEEDVEQAESREHRRWIERINAKLREKGKKDEAKRLREFVDAAYRLDPRITAYRQQQAAERERKKAEKAEARRLMLEEEQRQKAEEEARKRAEEEAAKAAAAEAKKAREAEKKLLKKERQRLRAIAASGEQQQRLLSEDDTEKLCQALDLQQLQQLCEAASAASGQDAVAAVLADAVRALQSAAEREATDREQKKRETAKALKDIAKRDHQKKLQEMREWNDDELRMLDKAVKKFPMGTPRRWEQVAAYVRTRTLDEVLLMVKEHQGASSTRLHKQEDWKGAANKRAEVTSEADIRDVAFTDVQVKLATDSAATEAAASTANSNSSSAASSRRSSSTGVAAAADSSSGTSSSKAAPAAAAAAPAAAAAAVPKPKKVVAESGEWSEEQELALVQALKQYGKELPDRWDRIATVVPGKSKAACFKRFKELREVFRAKKGGEPAE